MSTSQTTTGLSRPTNNDKISLGTFAYINARNRQRAYDIVIKEFEASGISQVALAHRMGKAADVVCRLLSRPQNWESDTFSSLLFAISGAVPKYEVTYPLGKPDFAKEPTFEIKRSITGAEILKLDDFRRIDDFRPGEFRLTGFGG